MDRKSGRKPKAETIPEHPPGTWLHIVATNKVAQVIKPQRGKHGAHGVYYYVEAGITSGVPEGWVIYSIPKFTECYVIAPINPDKPPTKPNED